MRLPKTGEWEIKREVNKGHREEVSASPKKTITSRNPGKEKISRRDGEVVLDLCFSETKNRRSECPSEKVVFGELQERG